MCLLKELKLQIAKAGETRQARIWLRWPFSPFFHTIYCSHAWRIFYYSPHFILFILFSFFPFHGFLHSYTSCTCTVIPVPFPSNFRFHKTHLYKFLAFGSRSEIREPRLFLGVKFFVIWFVLRWILGFFFLFLDEPFVCYLNSIVIAKSWFYFVPLSQLRWFFLRCWIKMGTK